jgi:predicted nuclease of predicted toxin-antitoxin system
MALQQRRLLLTEDIDFGELVVRDDLQHAGISLIRLDRMPVAEVNQRVASALPVLCQQLTGRFTVLHESGARMRPKPDQEGPTG